MKKLLSYLALLIAVVASALPAHAWKLDDTDWVYIRGNGWTGANWDVPQRLTYNSSKNHYYIDITATGSFDFKFKIGYDEYRAPSSAPAISTSCDALSWSGDFGGEGDNQTISTTSGHKYRVVVTAGNNGTAKYAILDLGVESDYAYYLKGTATSTDWKNFCTLTKETETGLWKGSFTPTRSTGNFGLVPSYNNNPVDFYRGTNAYTYSNTNTQCDSDIISEYEGGVNFAFSWDTSKTYDVVYNPSSKVLTITKQSTDPEMSVTASPASPATNQDITLTFTLSNFDGVTPWVKVDGTAQTLGTISGNTFDVVLPKVVGSNKTYAVTYGYNDGTDHQLGSASYTINYQAYSCYDFTSNTNPKAVKMTFNQATSGNVSSSDWGTEVSKDMIWDATNHYWYIDLTLTSEGRLNYYFETTDFNNTIHSYKKNANTSYADGMVEYIITNKDGETSSSNYIYGMTGGKTYRFIVKAHSGDVTQADLQVVQIVEPSVTLTGATNVEVEDGNNVAHGENIVLSFNVENTNSPAVKINGGDPVALQSGNTYTLTKDASADVTYNVVYGYLDGETFVKAGEASYTITPNRVFPKVYLYGGAFGWWDWQGDLSRISEMTTTDGIIYTYNYTDPINKTDADNQYFRIWEKNGAKHYGWDGDGDYWLTAGQWSADALKNKIDKAVYMHLPENAMQGVTVYYNAQDHKVKYELNGGFYFCQMRPETKTKYVAENNENYVVEYYSDVDNTRVKLKYVGDGIYKATDVVEVRGSGVLTSEEVSKIQGNEVDYVAPDRSFYVTDGVKYYGTSDNSNKLVNEVAYQTTEFDSEPALANRINVKNTIVSEVTYPKDFDGHTITADNKKEFKYKKMVEITFDSNTKKLTITGADAKYNIYGTFDNWNMIESLDFTKVADGMYALFIPTMANGEGEFNDDNPGFKIITNNTIYLTRSWGCESEYQAAHEDKRKPIGPSIAKEITDFYQAYSLVTDEGGMYSSENVTAGRNNLMFESKTVKNVYLIFFPEDDLINGKFNAKSFTLVGSFNNWNSNDQTSTFVSTGSLANYLSSNDDTHSSYSLSRRRFGGQFAVVPTGAEKDANNKFAKYYSIHGKHVEVGSDNKLQATKEGHLVYHGEVKNLDAWEHHQYHEDTENYVSGWYPENGIPTVDLPLDAPKQRRVTLYDAGSSSDDPSYHGATEVPLMRLTAGGVENAVFTLNPTSQATGALDLTVTHDVTYNLFVDNDPNSANSESTQLSKYTGDDPNLQGCYHMIYPGLTPDQTLAVAVNGDPAALYGASSADQTMEEGACDLTYGDTNSVKVDKKYVNPHIWFNPDTGHLWIANEENGVTYRLIGCYNNWDEGNVSIFTPVDVVYNNETGKPTGTYRMVMSELRISNTSAVNNWGLMIVAHDNNDDNFYYGNNNGSGYITEAGVESALGQNFNLASKSAPVNGTASGQVTVASGARNFWLDAPTLTLTVENGVPTKLNIKSTVATSIDDVEAVDTIADIYTMTGMVVKRDAKPADLKALQPGMYIYNGKTYLVH